MKQEDFYRHLAAISGPGILDLSPGPISIKIGKHDTMAAKLLLWLFDNMPEDATSGDLLDTLDAARWWSAFWFSLSTTGD